MKYRMVTGYAVLLLKTIDIYEHIWYNKDMKRVQLIVIILAIIYLLIIAFGTIKPVQEEEIMMKVEDLNYGR